MARRTGGRAMLTFRLCRADEIRAQLDRLGALTGWCCSCGRWDQPLTFSGCAACAPEDEAEATYWPPREEPPT